MKTTTLYDFTLTAGGAQVILADANMYKVLTAAGDISVTRDGGATIKPLRAGRGERNVAFTRLILRDLSGAPNSGTILVGDSDFIDDTIVLSSAIVVRPEAPSGTYQANGALGINVAEAIFTAASNTGGAILQNANISAINGAGFPSSALIAKATTPSTIVDGFGVAAGISAAELSATNYCESIVLKDVYIPAGQGLYFISSSGVAAGPARHARYKLL